MPAQNSLGKEEERASVLSKGLTKLALTNLALGTEYPACTWVLRSSPTFLLQKQTKELIRNVGF